MALDTRATVELAAGELRAVAAADPDLAGRLKPALRELSRAGLEGNPYTPALRPFREGVIEQARAEGRELGKADALADARGEVDRTSAMFRARADRLKEHEAEEREALLARRDALHEQAANSLRARIKVLAVTSGVFAAVAGVGWAL